MNSKERVFAALQGKPVDQRPCSAVLSLYGAKLSKCELKEYYTNPLAYSRGQSAVLEAFAPDILFSPFTLVSVAEAFGGESRYFNNQPPNMTRPAIASIDEISNMPVPGVNENPKIGYIRESVRLMSQAHGNETALVGIILSPVDLPLLLMGADGWMKTVLFDKDGARRMLDITIPFFIEFANALLRDGVHALALPVALFSPAITTKKIIEEFALPVLHGAFAQIEGPMFMHHVGGPFIKFLDLLKGLPNVIGFAMDHSDDLSRAREILGPGMNLLCGPDGPNMNKAAPHEIENRCANILGDRKDDPNFILCSTGADIPLDTPRENIAAMMQSVRNFGAAL